MAECEDVDRHKDVLTVDDEIRRGLLAVSKRPVPDGELRNFMILHSPRMHGSAELMLQYESACRQQQHIMHQRKTDWTAFWGKAATPRTDFTPCEIRRMKKGYYWRPPQPLLPNRHNIAPPPPHRACILHPRHPRLVNSRSSSAPQEDTVKKGPLQSILKKVQTSQVHSMAPGRAPIKLPPIGELDRYETDYEPIEFIARRNKLSFDSFISDDSTD